MSMDFFLFNASWMIFNLFLALLPVLFCWFLFKMPNKFFTFIVGLLWFLYLPNTIYVFTDLHHLVEQWSSVSGFGKIVLIYQYALLELIGLTCFLVAFYPTEKILRNVRISQKNITYILIAINFLIGFAMVLGKFERVNSWDVFVNPMFVVTSTLNMLLSYEMLALAVLLGLFTNFFYFLFRGTAKRLYTQWST